MNDTSYEAPVTRVKKSAAPGTTAALTAALALVFFSGLAARATDRGSTFNVAGDLSLLALLAPVAFLAGVALAVATILRWAWLTLAAARHRVPDSDANKVAHYFMAGALDVVLGLLTAGVLIWALGQATNSGWG